MCRCAVTGVKQSSDQSDAEVLVQSILRVIKGQTMTRTETMIWRDRARREDASNTRQPVFRLPTDASGEPSQPSELVPHPRPERQQPDVTPT